LDSHRSRYDLDARHSILKKRCQFINLRFGNRLPSEYVPTEVVRAKFVIVNEGDFVHPRQDQMLSDA